SAGAAPGRRSWLDWMLVGGATATFVGFGIVARVPQLTLGWGWVAGLTAAMLALLSGTGWLLWRTTRFN
ncbi:MAG: glucose uptake permease, partial [Gemmatimonadetes bacterium]